MIETKVVNDITYYSVSDINKILKEPSPTMVAERAIKANSLTEGKDYNKEAGSYFFTRKAVGKMLQPFERKLNGMMAIRAVKEISSKHPEKINDEPLDDSSKEILVKPKPDYSRRLTNINSYHITHHAEKRLNTRFEIPKGKQQMEWFVSIAPRLGYMGTQFGNTQEVWGNDEVTIITSPSEKSLITVLDPDMDVNVSNTHYDDIDKQFEQAVRSVSLKEYRAYWAELATLLQKMNKFAENAYEYLESNRNTNSDTGVETVKQAETDIISEYHKLNYDIESLTQDHIERLKYIESKR